MELSKLVGSFGMIHDPIKISNKAAKAVPANTSAVSNSFQRYLDCMVPSRSTVYPSVVKAMGFDFEMGSATCYDSVISVLGFELQKPYQLPNLHNYALRRGTLPPRLVYPNHGGKWHCNICRRVEPVSGLHHCAWGTNFDVCGKCLQHELGKIAVNEALVKDPLGMASSPADVMDAVVTAAVSHALEASEPSWIWHAQLLPRALDWIGSVGARRPEVDGPSSSLRLMQLATKQLDQMDMQQSVSDKRVQCHQYVVLKQKNDNVCGYHALFNAACMLELLEGDDAFLSLSKLRSAERFSQWQRQHQQLVLAKGPELGWCAPPGGKTSPARKRLQDGVAGLNQMDFLCEHGDGMRRHRRRITVLDSFKRLPQQAFPTPGCRTEHLASVAALTKVFGDLRAAATQDSLAYHVFILGTHDHWVMVAVTVLPKGAAHLPGLWVLESENKQMLRDAKKESKRAKVAQEMIAFVAECVWGERSLPFAMMVQRMTEFTDALTQHSFRDGENGAPPRVCVAGRTGSLESFALQQRELTRDVIHKLRKHSADEHRPSLPAEETQKLSAALVAATAAIRNHVHPPSSEDQKVDAPPAVDSSAGIPPPPTGRHLLLARKRSGGFWLQDLDADLRTLAALIDSDSTAKHGAMETCPEVSWPPRRPLDIEAAQLLAWKHRWGGLLELDDIATITQWCDGDGEVAAHVINLEVARRTCDKGHPLNYQARSNNTCDSCKSRDIKTKGTRYRCSCDCDYDMCFDCYNTLNFGGAISECTLVTINKAKATAEGLQGLRPRGDGVASKQSSAAATPPVVMLKDEDLAFLAAMGFDAPLAHAALMEAKGVLQRAVQILLN